MNRIVCLSIGWICAAVGTFGAFVPLLPTVPLYLLAALCFAKGSKRVHAWFVSTKLYQDNLKSYAEGKGMTPKTKARIMLTITVQMAIGYAFMGHVPLGARDYGVRVGRADDLLHLCRQNQIRINLCFSYERVAIW